MTRIFLTHPVGVFDNYFTQEALSALRAIAEVRLNALSRPLTTDELIEKANDCQIVVANPQMPAEAALFEGSPNLVALLKCANDVRNVALDAASANGILVANVTPAFVPAVSEMILGLMIDIARGISMSVIDFRAGRKPKVFIGQQLFGSTLGVIGYGVLGRYLCDLGLAMGMTVLVNDPYVKYTRPGLRQVDLPTLLAASDYVVCLAIATDETNDLMNADAFRRMKPTAYFINASRGSLVNEAALEQALDEGWIAGAALDVGKQPGNMPSPHIAKRDDVVATPHLGGRTPPSVADPAMETVEQAKAIIDGRIPHNTLNPEYATRLTGK